ncbi:D-alanyl-D-alanine carboxypeptidase / D-alanyl-D-alanine-endopeptidase (penicillin-binding protein 4) [Roseovarius tolerans]|uniref:D-alanyl-D-alanine carboxypeptidase / D-alanyl-D-alanine-endopeptidase (Penicillin-binding protein 4) n=1 Tax=Roseovarius tolerans TaxID=74031 RepID=A0A1H8A381_9RHOB|nr:D-alanyl-D-alanine carboxypeptidase/D-alanyl-D-alanine-endopeptidase [Roseovarius tolerans]SEM65372.1 D-alanyl-D-alanine carboxypeptidase / D-alanyl-D-alanine-endopeptidase (penicillin-binding protein 4) [Roseovarius tolerans]
MRHPFTRRLFLGAALSGMAGAALGGAPAVSLRPVARPGGGAARLAPSAEALVAEAQLSGQVGYAVADAASGQVLEEGDGATGLPPASVTKAVTALYALDTLGPGYRFETRLFATGVLEGGVLKGDLVLAGGGDPTLDTDALAALAAGLKKAGVREVRGQFRVWGGAVPFKRAIDEGQPEHVGYNPAISGLNLNYNRVHFEWKRAGGKYTVSMDARTARYRPDVTVARMQIADRSVPVYTYRDAGGRDDWTVARGALGNGGARWLPVRKPELYAAEVFATFARSHGIDLGKPALQDSAPQGGVVVTHHSAPLRDILRDMLKYSTNLTAEMVGLMTTAKLKGRALPLERSAQAMNEWAAQRLGMTGTALRDHSGLSDRSRLTAAAMAKGLARAHDAGLLRPLLREHRMRDANGREQRNHPVKVVAKTGTLYFVSSLAGYVRTPQGADLAFAIFTASDSLRSRIDPKRDERPPGARGWNRRSKQLQQALIERWSAVYGG